MGYDVKAGAFCRHLPFQEDFTPALQPLSRSGLEPSSHGEVPVKRDGLSKSDSEISRNTEDIGEDDARPGHNLVEGGRGQPAMQHSKGPPMLGLGTKLGADHSRIEFEIIDPKALGVGPSTRKAAVVIVRAHPIDDLGEGQWASKCGEVGVVVHCRRQGRQYHRSPMSSARRPDPALTALRRRAGKILRALKARYPEIGTALEYRDPWQLLVATVLSAQTTDETVNRITPVLFDRFPTPGDLAAANPEEVETIIFSSGFYHQKAKSVIKLSQAVVERFQGQVPSQLELLVTLPGVGRKTASVVLAEAFRLPAIAVDTHVARVTHRLELTSERNPVKIERDLRALFPKKDWTGVSMRFIQFGRDICDARRPLCGECELNRICRWPGKRV